MSTQQDRDSVYIRHLEGLADPEWPGGRAALAALRRGLGKRPGEVAEMFPYVAGWTEGLRGWPEETYYLVASLFALHPESWRAGSERSTNLGASLAWAGQDDGGGGVERRFVALLNSHRDGLSDHLRHVISLCAAHEVPIDWLCLLRDLRRWDQDGRYVQRGWARAFWRQPSTNDDQTTTEKG